MSIARSVFAGIFTTFGLLAMGIALIGSIPFSTREVPVVGAEIIGDASESDFVKIQEELEAPIRVDLFIPGAPKDYPSGVLQHTFNFNPQYSTYGALIVASSSAAALLPDTVDREQARQTLDNGGAVVAFDDGRLELVDQANLDMDSEILITPDTARSLGLKPTPYGSLFAGGKRVPLLDSLLHFNEVNPILVRNQRLSGYEPYFMAFGALALLCSLLVARLLARSWKVAATAMTLVTALLFLSQQPRWLPTWELVTWWIGICALTGIILALPRFRRKSST